MTDSELSNKRKRDTSEVDGQPDNAFQPRKRTDFGDYKILRPDDREDVRILPSQKYGFPGILLQIGVLHRPFYRLALGDQNHRSYQSTTQVASCAIVRLGTNPSTERA